MNDFVTTLFYGLKEYTRSAVSKVKALSDNAQTTADNANTAADGAQSTATAAQTAADSANIDS